MEGIVFSQTFNVEVDQVWMSNLESFMTKLHEENDHRARVGLAVVQGPAENPKEVADQVRLTLQGRLKGFDPRVEVIIDKIIPLKGRMDVWFLVALNES